MITFKRGFTLQSLGWLEHRSLGTSVFYKCEPDCCKQECLLLVSSPWGHGHRCPPEEKMSFLSARVFSAYRNHFLSIVHTSRHPVGPAKHRCNRYIEYTLIHLLHFNSNKYKNPAFSNAQWASCARCSSPCLIGTSGKSFAETR